MSIKKAAVDSALATAAKLLSGLVTIKILAITLGADGLGSISNAFSLVAIVTAFSGLGISLGVTRYVGEYLLDRDNLMKILQTASAFTLLSSFTLTMAGIVFSNQISTWLFHDRRYVVSIVVASCCIIPIGYCGLLISIINGLQKTRSLVYLQVFGAVFGSAGLVFAALTLSNSGAIVGLFWVVASPVIILPWITRRLLGSALFVFRPRWNKVFSRKLSKYSMAMLVGVVCQNTAQIIYRNLITESFGSAAVGNWQGVIRISDAYLQVFNVFLLVYLLPTLSREENKLRAIALLRRTYVFIIPALGVCLLGIYVMRKMLVKLILSESFEGVNDIIGYQLVGDFFRILAYIPGYLVLARGYSPLLFLGDPVQAIMIVVIGLELIPQYGAAGATASYAIGYLSYLVIVTFLLYKYKTRL